MTQHYLQIALNNWEDLNGWAVGHGVDLKSKDIDDFCHFVWWMLTRNSDEPARAKLRAQIWRPPPPKPGKPTERIDPRSPWSPEKERAAALAFKAQLMGGISPNSEGP